MATEHFFDGDRIERLERATERLSENVAGLSTSLAIVSEINARQAKLETRTAVAEAKAHEVSKNAVNKQYLQSELLTVQAANRRWRAWIISAIFGVLMLLTYVRFESVHQINDRLDGSLQVCRTTDAHLDIEIRLLSQPAPGRTISPAILEAISDMKKLRQDCNALFGPQNRPHFVQLGD